MYGLFVNYPILFLCFFIYKLLSKQKKLQVQYNVLVHNVIFFVFSKIGPVTFLESPFIFTSERLADHYTRLKKKKRQKMAWHDVPRFCRHKSGRWPGPDCAGLQAFCPRRLAATPRKLFTSNLVHLSSRSLYIDHLSSMFILPEQFYRKQISVRVCQEIRRIHKKWILTSIKGCIFCSLHQCIYVYKTAL